MQELQELMRIVPQCEASVGRSRCKAAGRVHLTLTHPKRPVQSADLCEKHAPVIESAALGQGYEVTRS